MRLLWRLPGQAWRKEELSPKDVNLALTRVHLSGTMFT